MRRPVARFLRVTSRATAGSRCAAITLVLISLMSVTALAVTQSWNAGGGADTDWTTDANWGLRRMVPGADDTAQFDRGAAFNYTVTFPFLPHSGGDITTDRLIVGSNAVTFEPDHSNTNYIVAAGATDETGRGVIIGEEANDTAAALTSHLELLSAAAATLGQVAGSSGSLTLNQNNDQFNVTGNSLDDTELIIGRYGTGILNVSGGADVNVPNESNGSASLAKYAGSSGTASISGAGSTLSIASTLVVGGEGAGALEITEGGQVTAHFTHIAEMAGSSGDVTIDGEGSTWTDGGSVFVGTGGNGSLHVTGGSAGNSLGLVAAYLPGSVGTITIDGTNSTWSANVGGVIIGRSGNGTMNITGGGELNNFATTVGFAASTVGAEPRSVGKVTIDGTGSTWNTNNNFFVGLRGSGTLDVTDGGQVNSANAILGDSPDSMGEVTLDGAGSTWTSSGGFYVGFAGTGALNITAGGHQYTAENAIVGSSSTGVGEVNVSGPGSKWSARQFFVGHNGRGTLRISDGAQAVMLGDGASGPTIIGNVAGAHGLIAVEGPGSSLNAGMSGSLRVGSFGNGKLQVTGGSTISGSISYIGTQPGSMGEVTIDGSGSNWTHRFDVFVGLGGHGTLSITGAGQLSDRDGYIGYEAGSQGAVTVDGIGSTWINTRDLHVGFNGDGSLTVTNDGTVQGINILVGTAGEIHGDGNLVGNVTSQGLVSPGTSPAALNIDGNYRQSASGALLIELASASSYDQLLVTGTATLAGTLTINLVEVFAPDIGQTFTIFTADVINGTFTTEMLPNMPNLRFDVTYNAQSVVVSVSSALPGDYNGDGTVDAADYVVWRKNDGTPQEYNTWRANFGATADGAAAVARTDAAGSASAAVPEPGTLVFVCASLTICTSLRRRRARRK